jgi:hypothetical protein
VSTTALFARCSATTTTVRRTTPTTRSRTRSSHRSRASASRSSTRPQRGSAHALWRRRPTDPLRRLNGSTTGHTRRDWGRRFRDPLGGPAPPARVPIARVALRDGERRPERGTQASGSWLGGWYRDPWRDPWRCAGGSLAVDGRRHGGAERQGATGRRAQRSQADARGWAAQASSWSLGRVVPRPLARSVATCWR